MHGGIKGVNAALDLGYDAADWLNKNGFFGDAAPGRGNTGDWDGGEVSMAGSNPRLRIPNLPDPQSPAGKMVSAISQFLVGFKGVDKLLKGVRAASYGANVAKGLGTGAVTDFAFFDGQEERLSNLVQSHPALATIPQDSGIGRGSKRDPARRARHRMCRVN